MPLATRPLTPAFSLEVLELTARESALRRCGREAECNATGCAMLRRYREAAYFVSPAGIAAGTEGARPSASTARARATPGPRPSPPDHSPRFGPLPPAAESSKGEGVRDASAS